MRTSGDVDDEGDGLSAGIWRSVGEARELRPPVHRPPGRHSVPPKFLRQLALRRYRRHLDSAVRRVRKPRPRQNRREKQRHGQHPHLHCNCPFAASGELPPRAQDWLEVDAGQVGCGQIQALQHRLDKLALKFIVWTIHVGSPPDNIKIFYCSIRQQRTINM